MGIKIRGTVHPKKPKFYVEYQFYTEDVEDKWATAESGKTDENGEIYYDVDFDTFPQTMRLYLPHQTIDGVEYEAYTTPEGIFYQYATYNLDLYPNPILPTPYALSIGVAPETGNVGDDFRFLGILTLSGSPMMGITVQLVLEGVGIVGEDVTGSMGNYDITWTADRSGTLLFHAEAPGLEVTSDTISITVEEAADFSFASILTDKPSYDVGEPVLVVFTVRNDGGGSGLFHIDFYDDDTGALLVPLDWPLSQPPGGVSEPLSTNVGAMPDKDWNIRCEITP